MPKKPHVPGTRESQGATRDRVYSAGRFAWHLEDPPDWNLPL